METHWTWPQGRRCTQATLEAFGVKGKVPLHNGEVIAALEGAGYKVEPLEATGTVKLFCAQHPRGAYYLSTLNHAMALVDGNLVDSAGKGPDSRVLKGVYEVTRVGGIKRAKGPTQLLDLIEKFSSSALAGYGWGFIDAEGERHLGNGKAGDHDSYAASLGPENSIDALQRGWIRLSFNPYTTNLTLTRNPTAIKNALAYLSQEHPPSVWLEILELEEDKKSIGWDAIKSTDNQANLDCLEAMNYLRGLSPTKQAAPAVTDTPAFKAWFKESKVLDKDGKPLVCYHATKRDFDTFKTEPRDIGDDDIHCTLDSIGAWFSDNRNFANAVAKFYEKRRPGNTLVKPVYLSIQNPLEIQSRSLFEAVLQTKTLDQPSDTKAAEEWHQLCGDNPVEATKQAKTALIKQGYDGIHILDDAREGSSWIAFYPNQIKSALGNRGTFDEKAMSITAKWNNSDFYKYWFEVKSGKLYQVTEDDGRGEHTGYMAAHPSMFGVNKKQATDIYNLVCEHVPSDSKTKERFERVLNRMFRITYYSNHIFINAGRDSSRPQAREAAYAVAGLLGLADPMVSVDYGVWGNTRRDSWQLEIAPADKTAARIDQRDRLTWIYNPDSHDLLVERTSWPKYPPEHWELIQRNNIPWEEGRNWCAGRGLVEEDGTLDLYAYYGKEQVNLEEVEDLLRKKFQDIKHFKWVTFFQDQGKTKWVEAKQASGTDAKLAFPRQQTISLQEALDRKMFGPVYHGTTEDSREQIEEQGFKFFEENSASGNTANGYSGDEYYAGIPAPVHHLGYGVYFSSSKAIAKQFNGGTTKGLKTYYLDVPRLETINFASPKTMMSWWKKNGYDTELAKIDRIAATKKLTENLKNRFDAVWFKGKGLRKLLDGDQIVVFDSTRIYQIDTKLAKPGEIGSQVKRKSDGMVGVILNRREVKPEWKEHWGESTEIYAVAWKKGGKDYNVPSTEVELLAGKQAASRATELMWVTWQGQAHIEPYGKFKTHTEWLESIGAPSSGPKFDLLDRGRAYIDNRNKKIRVLSNTYEMVPMGVMEELEKTYPDYEIEEGTSPS